jgi:outer membrane immunogenic protein
MALAATIAGPAIAADMPAKVKAPPPVAVYDWSGAYVGFNIGGVWTEVDRHYPNLGQIGFPATTFTSKGNDTIYGLHAGAQRQWGQWVFGVEAAYSAGSKEMRSSVTLNPVSPLLLGLPNFEAYNKITNLFTVGPRLGFAWDRWMIYGTGGYATGTVHGQYRAAGLQIFGPPGPNLSGHSWNDGWFAGGGFEYMAHKGALVDVILGVEYQHVDLRSKNAFADANFGGLFNFDHDAVVDIVRARLTIKTQGWGWAGPWGGPVAAKY